MISPSQRPLPDNTQHSQRTNIHAPGGIRTHNLSRRAAKDLRLRPRGHWDRLLKGIVTWYLKGRQVYAGRGAVSGAYKSKSVSPRRGIEPRYPAWEAGGLPSCAFWMAVCMKNVQLPFTSVVLNLGSSGPLVVPYILEFNPHPFYSFRGLKNQMRIRIACGLDSGSRAGFWKNDRAAVRAVRTIQ